MMSNRVSAPSRHSRRLAPMLAVVAVVASFSARVQAQEAGIAVGTQAPSAAVQRLDGSATDLSQFIGKTPVVMEFWATWCPLCKQLEPQFKSAQERLGASVKFVSVGVNANQTRQRQRQYVTDKSLGGTHVFDVDGKAMAAYKVPHTSYVVVLNAKGTVVYTGVGPEQDISAAIAKAMDAR